MSNILLESGSRSNRDALRARVASLAAAAHASVVCAAQVAWQFLTLAFNLSDELLRMADECEATRPEQAAQLRKAARQGWGW